MPHMPDGLSARLTVLLPTRMGGSFRMVLVAVLRIPLIAPLMTVVLVVARRVGSAYEETTY